ncbi:MAG: hypothetical protein CMK00_05930 [Planctomycetes bacterium]|nr:hypothetical protein [Planctomycetota bacterium]HJO26047.1 hypothetical protein [Planctomycetota bacterium]
MNVKRGVWVLAKLLEGVGMLVVLAGVFRSMSLGMEDESLASMSAEFQGLTIGGGMFILGWLLERSVGSR